MCARLCAFSPILCFFYQTNLCWCKKYWQLTVLTWWLGHFRSFIALMNYTGQSLTSEPQPCNQDLPPNCFFEICVTPVACPIAEWYSFRLSDMHKVEHLDWDHIWRFKRPSRLRAYINLNHATEVFFPACFKIQWKPYANYIKIAILLFFCLIWRCMRW